MRKCVSLFLAVIVCLSLFACGKKSSEGWPTTGLGAMLPRPDAKKISIGYDIGDSFSADIEKAKEEDFTKYVAKCEEAGFTVEAEQSGDEYAAYNPEGYRVEISFYDSLKSVSIRLDAPRTNGALSWPSIGLATLLPTPEAAVGTIKIDSSTQFTAWVGETTFDVYKAYVQKCIEKGFSVDYSNYEKVYSADNENGVSLRLEYQGFNTMYIALYAPDEPILPTLETVTMETVVPTESIASNDEEENEELVEGMRPEFKEALDSYEAFFEEYCEIMKKYAKNPSDLGLIADYAKYLSQYAEMTSKLEALDDGEMNDAEMKYYLEVTARITQMLLDAADVSN